MKSSPVRQNLVRKIRNIGTPNSVGGYYSGCSHTKPGIPDHILFFTRRREHELSRGPMVGSRHHRFVLILCLETSGRVHIDKKTIRLDPGQAVLVFPEQFHWFSGFAAKRLSWLFITFELGGWASLARLRDVALSLSEIVLGDIFRLTNLWAAPERTRRCNQLALMLAFILEELTRERALRLSSAEISAENTSAHLLMQNINDFVLRELPKTTGVKQVADHLHVSESHLRFIFRNATGTSLGSYLRELRIYRSVGFLVQGEMNVSQIASACGFNSTSAYIRAFRAIFQCPPLEYRKTRIEEAGE